MKIISSKADPTSAPPPSSSPFDLHVGERTKLFFFYMLTPPYYKYNFFLKTVMVVEYLN